MCSWLLWRRGWWAGWTFGLSHYVSFSFLWCIYRVLSKKEALLSKFGPTGVKSGLPRTSHMMLSKLCRSHPLRLHRHLVGSRHLNTFEDLDLNFLGCTDSVWLSDGELWFTPIHRAALQLANCLKAAHSQLLQLCPAVCWTAYCCATLLGASGLVELHVLWKLYFFLSLISLRVPCDPFGIGATGVHNLGCTEVLSWAKFMVPL